MGVFRSRCLPSSVPQATAMVKLTAANNFAAEMAQKVTDGELCSLLHSSLCPQWNVGLAIDDEPCCRLRLSLEERRASSLVHAPHCSHVMIA